MESQVDRNVPCVRWNVPTACPNCSRSCTSSTAISNAECIRLGGGWQTSITGWRLWGRTYPSGLPLSTNRFKSRPDMSTLAPPSTGPNTFSERIQQNECATNHIVGGCNHRLARNNPRIRTRTCRCLACRACPASSASRSRQNHTR